MDRRADETRSCDTCGAPMSEAEYENRAGVCGSCDDEMPWPRQCNICRCDVDPEDYDRNGGVCDNPDCYEIQHGGEE